MAYARLAGLPQEYGLYGAFEAPVGWARRDHLADLRELAAADRREVRPGVQARREPEQAAQPGGASRIQPSSGPGGFPRRPPLHGRRRLPPLIFHQLFKRLSNQWLHDGRGGHHHDLAVQERVRVVPFCFF